MTSQRKIDANRRNATRSTGPKTARGKAFSSRNSTTHGLTAKSLCIGDESPAGLDRLIAEITADHQPANRTEMELVETLALTSWRLRRANRYEIDLLQKRVDHGMRVGDSDYRDSTVASRPAVAFGDIAYCGPQLRDLHRQEQRLRRTWFTTYTELGNLHKTRRKEEQKRTNEPNKSPGINTGSPVQPNSTPPAPEPAATAPPAEPVLQPTPTVVTAPPPPERSPSPTQSSLILFCCLLLSLLRGFFSNVRKCALPLSILNPAPPATRARRQAPDFCPPWAIFALAPQPRPPESVWPQPTASGRSR